MITPVAIISSFLLATTSHGAPPTADADIVRYQLSLRPNLDSGEIAGSETIEFRSSSDGLRDLLFSANNLKVESATFAGLAVGVERSEQGVRFLLPKSMPQGQAGRLKIVFSGKPKRGLTVANQLLYASYFTCDWMFCAQDAPGDKAIFDLDLALPAGASSLGVGRRLPRPSRDGALEFHRWRSGRAYSPYLFGFVAGAFERVTATFGRRHYAFVNATGKPADLETAFAETASIADFFETKAGLPLPGGRYTQVLVPGEEAQEVGTYALIGAQALSRDLEHPTGQWILAHEMAHQWWGNAVTCASWRDFWLNEGFATFMTAAWKEERFGEAAYQAELDVARSRSRRAAALGFDKPLTWAGPYPSLNIRRAIQYSKGALFLDRLRTVMGEEAFWTGIRHYTRRYAGKTVRSEDFQAVMTEASPHNIAPLFTSWVFGADEALPNRAKRGPLFAPTPPRAAGQRSQPPGTPASHSSWARGLGRSSDEALFRGKALRKSWKDRTNRPANAPSNVHFREAAEQESRTSLRQRY